MISENKLCENCNKIIRGRSDKKFCNDYCRNVYNNSINSPANNLVRRINIILCKNRRILDALFKGNEKVIKIKKEILIQGGYVFKYTTGVYATKKGLLFYFCYDYSVVSITEELYVVIKQANI